MNDVVYAPGGLKVVAYDKAGKAALAETVRTAGPAASLRVEKRRFGNLLFATVSVVDAKGEVVPDADDMIEVAGRGKLRFRAICNGDETSLEMFYLPRMKAFHGRLVAIFEGEGTEISVRRPLLPDAAGDDCR